MKAALALAARNDKRITNEAWKNGLKKLPDSEVARNVILPDQTVAALVSGSYEEDCKFGLLIDVLAETGARESQMRQQSAGRSANAPLFHKMWGLATLLRPVVERLGLGPEVTPYALRHSSIVRQLLKGVPTRVVAAHHDTSVAMIEKNYSRYIIGDPSDALTRATLLDLAELPISADVVAISRQAA